MLPTQKSAAEEIDILYFLQPIGTFFKNIYTVFAKFFRKVIRNFFLFASVTLVCFITGFSLRYFLPKQYQTNAIFITHELPAELCSLDIQSLNQLIKGEQTSNLLAQKLQIAEKTAATIRSIKAELIDDISIDKVSDTTSQLFRITLRTENTEVLDTLQSSIVRFLENNAYSKKRKEAKKHSLNLLKISLLKKVESLDSLKQLVNSSIVPRSKGQGIILGEPVDPVSIYQAEVAYFKEQLKIDEELATLDNIEVVQPFFKLNTANYPNFNNIAFYFLLGGFIFALIIIPYFGKK